MDSAAGVMKSISLRSKRWKTFLDTEITNFYTLYASWLTLLSFIGAILIYAIDSVDFLDALFVSVSAVTCTGLSTISMLELSTGSFVVLFFEMLLSSVSVLLIPPLVTRYVIYKRMRPKIKVGDEALLEEFDKLNEALVATIWVVLSYVFLWHFFGLGVIIGALYLQPMEPELARRNFTYVANAAFLTVSHYANAGFSLSSSSVFYWKDNPVAYLAASALVVAGNTMLAVFLRSIVIAVRDVRKWLGWDISAYQYILDHPRRVTTQIFSHEQTVFLAYASTGLFIVNFVFFLGSSMNRPEVLAAYGSQTTIAGIGFYQVVLTRSAGAQILDMRTMNQGMLLVFVLMMYISTAPFLAVLHSSEQTEKMTIRTQLGTLEYRLRHGDDATLHFDELGSNDFLGGDDDSDNDDESDKNSDDGRGRDGRTGLGNTGASTGGNSAGRGNTGGNTGPASPSNTRSVGGVGDDIIIPSSSPGTGSAGAANGAAVDGNNNNNNKKGSDDTTVRTFLPPPSSLPLSSPHAPPTYEHVNSFSSSISISKLPMASSPAFPISATRNDESNVTSASGGGDGDGRGSIFLRRRLASDASFIVSNGGNGKRIVINSPSTNTLIVAPSSGTTSDLIPPPPPPGKEGGPPEQELLSAAAPSPETRSRFMQAYVMRHTFFILAAIFICVYTEDGLLTTSPEDFNLFYIIYEVVSAYGNVGMSMGVPGQAYSMSGVFTTLGKLVIIATMMLGKCRGLPKRNDIVIDFRMKHLRRMAGLTRESRVRVRDAIQAVATRIVPRSRASIATAFRVGSSDISRHEGGSGAATAAAGVQSTMGTSSASATGGLSSGAGTLSLVRHLSLSPSATTRLFARRTHSTIGISTTSAAVGRLGQRTPAAPAPVTITSGSDGDGDLRMSVPVAADRL